MSEHAKILESVKDLTATDPLSEVSRGERKMLLSVTLVAIAVAKGGLVPSEIPALGINLSPAERLSILYLLVGVLVFYLIGFWLYGRADLKRRRALLESASVESRKVVHESIQKFESQKPATADIDVDAEQRRLTELGAVSGAVQLVTDITRFAQVRIVYDVYLPVALGIIALALVLHETWSYPGGRAITWTLISGAVLGCLILGWLRRKKISHWFAVRRHRFFHRRFMRLSNKLKALPEDSPKRERLQKKIEPYLKRALKGPWV